MEGEFLNGDRLPVYMYGETILPGYKILFGDWEGRVDFVMTSNWSGWGDYCKELGEGVMLSGKTFGSLYTPFDNEDLVFVSRHEDR